MRRYITLLNIVFVLGLAITVGVAFGILPRVFAFIFLGIYAYYMLTEPLENGTALFLRSIPFFIALPLVEGFDNLNIWRILLLVLFLKWLVVYRPWDGIVKFFRDKPKISLFVKRHTIEIFGALFLIFAAVSVFVALDAVAAITKLIFIINGAAIFVILTSIIQRSSQHLYILAKNFAYSGLLAVFFGYLQFAAAYFAPPWVFHWWWGQVVSLGMYGKEWADIVTNFGNTWFSYSGSTLRLRMFSTFPDSHSFPVYVIMTIPAMIYSVFSKFTLLGEWIKSNTGVFSLIKNKTVLWMLGVFAIINLALILTGTRGVWVAGVLAGVVILLFKATKIEKQYIRLLYLWIIIFVIMFPVYFGIISFPQFQESDVTTTASLDRISSIIDFGEVSNQGRINIWKTTVDFIAQSPVLGVGIGNYPIILQEPQSAAQAGASAHNFYLHVFSTIGIFGLVSFLVFIFEIVRRGIIFLRRSPHTPEGAFLASMLFALAWIGAYIMTDAVLYDGRALLAFMAITGITTGLLLQRNQPKLLS